MPTTSIFGLLSCSRSQYCVIPARLRAGRNSHLKATISSRSLAASVSYSSFLCTGLILRTISPKNIPTLEQSEGCSLFNSTSMYFIHYHILYNVILDDLQ